MKRVKYELWHCIIWVGNEKDHSQLRISQTMHICIYDYKNPYIAFYTGTVILE